MTNKEIATKAKAVLDGIVELQNAAPNMFEVGALGVAHMVVNEIMLSYQEDK